MRGWLPQTAAIACGLLIVLGVVRPAEAGEGNYRGPGGLVPPNLREPTDIAPPPPPPPGRTPALPRGPVVRPRDEPVAPTPVRSVPDFSAWMFWYHHQRDLLEPRPERARALARSEPRIAAEILPQLMRLSDRKRHGDPALAVSALHALGRAARTEAHVDRLLAVLEGDDLQLLRQAAAIGLGFLRRTAPDEPFPAIVLDRVRDRLYRILKNDALPGRLRAAAAAATGMLADQPASSSALARVSVARLWKILALPNRYRDLDVALLQAASLYAQAAWSESQYEQLHQLVHRKHPGKAGQRGILDAHATLALGRVGRAKDIGLLAQMLRPENVRRRNVRRAAVVALGTLAERLDASVRGAVVGLLVGAMATERDPTTHKLMTITLARTAAAGLRAGAPVEGDTADITGVLRAVITPDEHGELVLQRHASYAMLGLGLMGLELRKRTGGTNSAWIRDTATAVRKIAVDALHDERHRGAAVLTLGMLGSRKDLPLLLDIAADRTLGGTFRGAAARGCMYLGPLDTSTSRTLRVLVTEPGTPFPVDYDSAAALGVGDADVAAPVLLAHLERAGSLQDKGIAARALADLGASDVLEALLKILTDANAHTLTRQAACVALGLAASGEPYSGLGRLVANSNWRMHGGHLAWLAGIL